MFRRSLQKLINDIFNMFTICSNKMVQNCKKITLMLQLEWSHMQQRFTVSIRQSFSNFDCILCLSGIHTHCNTSNVNHWPLFNLLMNDFNIRIHKCRQQLLNFNVTNLPSRLKNSIQNHCCTRFPCFCGAKFSLKFSLCFNNTMLQAVEF